MFNVKRYKAMILTMLCVMPTVQCMQQGPVGPQMPLWQQHLANLPWQQEPLPDVPTSVEFGLLGTLVALAPVGRPSLYKNIFAKSTIAASLGCSVAYSLLIALARKKERERLQRQDPVPTKTEIAAYTATNAGIGGFVLGMGGFLVSSWINLLSMRAGLTHSSPKF